MNRELLYHKTVDQLLDAYSDGKLKHNSYNACAVGNILNTNTWGHLFFTVNGQLTFRGDPDFIDYIAENSGLKGSKLDMSIERGMRSVKNSGYSIAELAMIETSFEKYGSLGKICKAKFEALVDILTALQAIHEIGSETANVKMKRLNEIKADLESKEMELKIAQQDVIRQFTETITINIP